MRDSKFDVIKKLMNVPDKVVNFFGETDSETEKVKMLRELIGDYEAGAKNIEITEEQYNVLCQMLKEAEEN